MQSTGSRATCERPSKDDDTTELTRNDLDSGFPGIPDQNRVADAIGTERAGHVGFPPRQRDLTKVSLEQSLRDFFCCLTALCSRRKFYEAV
jgi:hypothetical protein